VSVSVRLSVCLRPVANTQWSLHAACAAMTLAEHT